MNDLKTFFDSSNHRLIDKYEHYFEIYDRHFFRFRGKAITFVEFGVSHGGSLQMWKKYFGDHAKIIGIDINPECKKFEEDQIQIFIGSQEDSDFLNQLQQSIKSIDILLDDGGHTMKQQKMTFKHLYNSISPGGVYLCEDLHTSYMPSYGGGFRRKSNFIEYTKNYIDLLNVTWINKVFDSDAKIFHRSTYSIHYYDSVVVMEKRSVEPIKKVIKGEPSLQVAFKMKRSSYMFNPMNIYYKLRKHLRLG
ncbi:MAG: class I SAM-dependent methyltransferase [Flavisolibacter sp.]